MAYVEGRPDHRSGTGIRCATASTSRPWGKRLIPVARCDRDRTDRPTDRSSHASILPLT